MRKVPRVRREWSPRQESNLYLALRRRPFYPLNYEEAGRHYGVQPPRAEGM
jgi:hypothetical protein